MSRFTRHWRCSEGHRMTSPGTELTHCLAYVGPVKKRRCCEAELREVGVKVKWGDRGG